MAEEGQPAILTLSDQGSIEGEVRAPVVVINGQLTGDVHAAERVELAANARVQGNVHYRVVEMSAGAQLTGRLIHARRWRRCRRLNRLAWPRGTLESDAADPHAEAMSTFVPLPAAIAPDYQSLERPLNFSVAAASKVRELIQEEATRRWRCGYISKAAVARGSSMVSSSMKTAPRDDVAVATDGVVLLVDPLSLQYLMGAEVDYTESLHGAQFVIRNPNAKTTCGCGSSFQHVASHDARWMPSAVQAPLAGTRV